MPYIKLVTQSNRQKLLHAITRDVFMPNLKQSIGIALATLFSKRERRISFMYIEVYIVKLYLVDVKGEVRSEKKVGISFKK